MSHFFFAHENENRMDEMNFAAMLTDTLVACNVGSAFGTREKRRSDLAVDIDLRGGTNQISLLSATVGLQVGL